MNKKKISLVPALRFPDFVNSGDWADMRLGDLICPVEERAGTKKYTLMSVNTGQGLITQIEKFGREIAGSAYKNYYVIKKGDFAYNKSATKQYPEGYISMLTEYEEGALPNSIFTCFRVIDKNTYSKIFDHLFHANYHGSWLRQYIKIGGRANGALSIDNRHLWAMPITLPEFEEQQKIADCLSSMDELITAEGKKLLALKQYKKGLMQKLFPAEGKTIPQLRFPEFVNSGDWGTSSLGEVCGITGGAGFPIKYQGLKNLAIPFIKVSDMNLTKNLKYITVANNYIDQETAKILNAKILPVNTVVIAKVGAAIFLERKRIVLVPCCIDNNMMGLIPKPFLNPQYFYQYLTTVLFSELAQGNTLPAINNTIVSEIPFPLPCLEEQEKIADCLSELDKRINAQTKKINTLKLHKKALMQKLFPSFKEMGAEINSVN